MLLRIVLPLVMLSTLASACTSRDAAAVQAPMVVNVAPVGSAAPIEAPSPRSGPGDCRVSLRVREPIALSSPGCYLDEHIRENVGTLVYDCDGNGHASAVFGTQRYEGAITNGDINIQAETELDWDDGCHWGTTAIIRGRVTGKLVWTYEDRVLAGNACSGICHANTTLDVEK